MTLLDISNSDQLFQFQFIQRVTKLHNKKSNTNYQNYQSYQNAINRRREMMATQ